MIWGYHMTQFGLELRSFIAHMNQLYQ